MATGKWISDLTAATPLVDAARRVLTVRLQVVADHLEQAVNTPEADVEHVHQLRVGTRRSRAALDIFADCMSKKAYKKAKRELRHLRRAAGDARDWDVFLDTLCTQADADTNPNGTSGLDCLTGYALAQRAQAQDTLRAAVPEPLQFGDWQTEFLTAVRPTKRTKATTLVELATPTLRKRIEDVEVAAAADFSDYNNLHNVRIVGKQLRYAMEVFYGVFPKAFRKTHYAAIEEMQGILGLANDSSVAIERLSLVRKQMNDFVPKRWTHFEADIAALIQFHHDRLPKQRTLFEQWWERWTHEGGKDALEQMIDEAS